MKVVPTLVLAAAALAAGCGGGDGHPKLTPAAVSGTVTLDGKPLADGTIAFTAPGNIPTEIKITNGTYAGEAYVGRNHIQFAVYRPLGKPKANLGPGADEGVSMENVLPARYNQESQEYREVKDGSNEFNFDLRSK